MLRSQSSHALGQLASLHASGRPGLAHGVPGAIASLMGTPAGGHMRMGMPPPHPGMHPVKQEPRDCGSGTPLEYRGPPRDFPAAAAAAAASKAGAPGGFETKEGLCMSLAWYPWGLGPSPGL